MADKTIGELPKASEVFDDSLLVMEQQAQARSVTGALIKKYAVAAAQEQAETAKGYAEEGKAYRDAAAESAKDAADVALHPPILKDGSDHWWTWSTEANDYVESDADAGVSLEVSPETVTGEPGSAAKVDNLGTKTDPVLRFTLPQGAKGDTGGVGPKGDKGDTGGVGPKGDKGDAATITIGTVTTGEPGTEAQVTNRGTTSNPILDFTIPNGATGATGPVGPVGPAGPQGKPGEVSRAEMDQAISDAIEATKAVEFDVQLTASGWAGKRQSVSNPLFEMDGFNYLIAPAPSDLVAYNDASVHAEDMTAAGSMVFVCDETPADDLTAHIMKVASKEE